MPQANSTISMPRCISARASAIVLPCSRVTRAASSSKRALQQLAEAKHDAGPLDRRRLAPGGQRLGGAANGPVDLVGRAERDPRLHAPVEGLKTSPRRSLVERFESPADQSNGTRRWQRHCVGGRRSEC